MGYLEALLPPFALLHAAAVGAEWKFHRILGMMNSMRRIFYGAFLCFCFASLGQSEIESFATSDSVKVQLSFIHNGSYRKINAPFHDAAHNLIRIVKSGEKIELRYYRQIFLDDSLEFIGRTETTQVKLIEFLKALELTRLNSESQLPEAWCGPTPTDYIIISTRSKKLSFPAYDEQGRDAFRLILEM
jgi:hypothetical protein